MVGWHQYKEEICAEHPKDGMVDVHNKRCSRSGCNRQPSFGKVGGKAELCAEHAEDGMGGRGPQEPEELSAATTCAQSRHRTERLGKSQSSAPNMPEEQKKRCSHPWLQETVVT